MTLIVSYSDGNKSYIAGDRASVCVSQLSQGRTKHPKIFSLKYEYHDNNTKRERSMLVGYTTSFRMGQILEHHLEVPPRYNTEDLYSYMVKKMVPLIKNLFQTHWTEKSNYNEVAGGEFIIVMEHRTFVVQTDFAVLEFESKFCAVGCGENYAVAGMKAFEMINHDVYDSLDKIFDIASNFSIGVSTEHDIIEGN